MRELRARITTALLSWALLLAHLDVVHGAPASAPEPTQHELHATQPPARLVTLLPSLTESVCALGACGRIVATDRYSNYPPEVLGLPKAGGLQDVQIEQIVAARPDVVLLAHATRVAERLRTLNIPVLELQTESYDDIAHTIEVLGSLLAVPDRAQALIQQIHQDVDRVAQSARTQLAGRTPSVYYEVDSGPYAAGPDSFIGALLARLGTRNIIDSALGAFPKINPEYVVSHNPDIIFVSPTEAPRLTDRPGWAQIRAVREHRLCSYPPEVRDVIVRPGPRVAQGLQALADCLVRVAP
jgi:iron complex transport system substrate-binding protein